MNKNDVILSKSLSWLLRHGAMKEGLSISSQGYVEVAQILQHRTLRGKYNITDIERVVNNNDKQRFKLSLNPQTQVLEIKANQGHSIRQVGEQDLIPILEPKYKTVVHGTYLRFWPQIKVLGLSRMSRQHIHFAKGTLEDSTVISGFRRDVELYIFIDLKKVLEGGIHLYESENGVILTSGDDKGFLLPKYFLKVCKVDTGYPNYTMAADLVKSFRKIGKVKVERMTDRSAVLSCASALDVQRALEQTNTLSVYGQFLAVRPYSAAADNQRYRDQARDRDTKRDFTRSKTKESVIADPAQLGLSGDFHSQVDTILASIRLTQLEVQQLSQLYNDVEQVLSVLWPGCVAMPFGSITTGLGIKTSDADCFLDVPVRFRQLHANFVTKAKRILQQHPLVFAEILSIPRANTPIIKFHHVPTNTNCDLSFKTPLGAQNSKLITFLLHCDPKSIPIAVIIKYWGKVHGLTGTGKLSNYALTMLIIFYLQQPPMSILPSVEWLQRDSAYDCIVDYWNTGFMNKRELLPPTTNTSSIAELLGGFFEYYSNFNFEEIVVCPFLGRLIKKEELKNLETLPNEFARYKENTRGLYTNPLKIGTAFCIQDPFEQSHNVASGVTFRMASEIVAYFKFAANAYEKDKLNHCKEFLKTILTDRPKIARNKPHPEYRVNLFPRTVNTIVDDDWKARVREAVFNIFEKIFKLNLGKIEEKTNPDMKKEKEKYWTLMNTAVWKRKQYAKDMSLDFLERESLLTAQILEESTEKIEVEFQVLVVYCQQPRSVVVTIRFSRGDAESFRDFGRFYVSVMQSWFIALIRPYTRHQGRNIPDVGKKGDAADTTEDQIEDDDSEDDDEDEDSNVNSDASSPQTEPSDKAIRDAEVRIESCCLED